MKNIVDFLLISYAVTIKPLGDTLWICTVALICYKCAMKQDVFTYNHDWSLGNLFTQVKSFMKWLRAFEAGKINPLFR